MDNERIAHWTDCADRCDNVLRDRNTKLDNALCDASNMLREAARALSADRGEAVAWLITWNDGTKKVSFDQCHRDDGTCCPLYAATPPSPAESAEGDARSEADDYEAMFAAYKTWPEDVRKKLSAHDLRRMGGWRPMRHRVDAAAPSQVSDAMVLLDSIERSAREFAGASSVGGFTVPKVQAAMLRLADQIETVSNALAAQPQPGRVEGMVLVPRIPTDAMRGAWIEHRPDDASFYDADLASVIGWANETWDAMLAAAPTAGGAK